ncbi:hypothetical protein Kisp01_71230 [Kineosporia sp. NBRC 101677]|uniref:hypothetical protein n=1 Tax=Kineosporia sp. NBRC 101677 TaxID=3032197 RepID=UPI00249FD357|nr:hypothetical protein [Kineosporia sp. NBRC 101677]GLY20109.1 hypothetical protein Kisp01_71230 [Kineosporia sp. NBRC 101677]
MRLIQHDARHLWSSTTVVDTEAIDHERPIARVALETETVLIRVAQRVDFNLLAEPVEVMPYPPRITLGDYELNDGQAREIARHLLTAVEFVDGLGWARSPRRPRLVPRG